MTFSIAEKMLFAHLFVKFNQNHIPYGLWEIFSFIQGVPITAHCSEKIRMLYIIFGLDYNLSILVLFFRVFPVKQLVKQHHNRPVAL